MLKQTYQGISPTLKGAFAAPNATAVGRVTLGPGAALWYGAVARGDQNDITVGANTNLQDNAVLHVSPAHPLKVGSGVTVGHGAILHGCTVGDNTLIGMGAILLNGCVIGENCLVAAGALVPEGMIVPPGSLVMGMPAKVRRPLTPEEIEGNRRSAEHYCTRAAELLEEQP